MKKTCSFAAGVSGDTVIISGAGFGIVDADVSVEIGGAPCVITLVTDTSIECIVGEREGGPAEIKV